MIRQFLLRRAEAIMASRSPDFEIGPEGDRYLLRWWIIPRNKFFNLYLHRFLHDDEDRALHDHPWMNCSVVLKNGYYEVIPRANISADSLTKRPNDFYRGDRSDVVKVHRLEGSVTFRRATAAHRVVLLRRYAFSADGRTKDFVKVPIEAVTLFFTGPVIREWGFYCDWGWCPWQQFVSTRDKGSIGRGCE